LRERERERKRGRDFLEKEEKKDFEILRLLVFALLSLSLLLSILGTV
jgi:predicted nucleic acid-binding Zn ribbon protein